MTAVGLAVASAILLAPVATHEVQPAQQGTVAAAPSLSPESAAALEAAKAAFKANHDAALKVVRGIPLGNDFLEIRLRRVAGDVQIENAKHGSLEVIPGTAPAPLWGAVA